MKELNKMNKKIKVFKIIFGVLVVIIVGWEVYSFNQKKYISNTKVEKKEVVFKESKIDKIEEKELEEPRDRKRE